MKTPLIELLYEALNTPLGVIVNCTNPVLLRTKLYPLKKHDPDFERLGFVISPSQPDTQLWIVVKPEREIA